MKKYFYVLLGFIVLGLIIGKLTIWKSPQSNGAETITAQKMDLAQEVTVTGRVKSSRDVSLGFTRGGKIIAVNVSVGDAVAQGNILARQDHADLDAQLEAAKAAVQAEEAKLRDMQAGTRPEQIDIQKAKVTNAESAVSDASQSLVDKLRDAFAKADDAVRNKSDQMFSNPRTPNPQLSFNTDTQSSANIVSARVRIEGLFGPWGVSLAGLRADSKELQSIVETSRANLNTINMFLDELSLSVNQLSNSATLTSTTLSSWRSDLNTARTNVQTAISNISTGTQSLNTANATLRIEQGTLTLQLAGSTDEQLASEASVVASLQAKVEQLRAQIADTAMVAPSYGVVSSVDAKVGQIAQAGTPLVRIVSTTAYDIEASIPETDIGNVALGNTVIITLDAFAGETFTGKVVLIDPAESIIDGVVNFKTTIRLDKVDSRVKSGMTANLRIQTVVKKQVLALPQYAILETDAGKFVRILSETKSPSTTAITTGIRNPEGYVEIISGLNEGDRVQNIGIKQ